MLFLKILSSLDCKYLTLMTSGNRHFSKFFMAKVCVEICIPSRPRRMHNTCSRHVCQINDHFEQPKIQNNVAISRENPLERIML